MLKKNWMLVNALKNILVLPEQVENVLSYARNLLVNSILSLSGLLTAKAIDEEILKTDVLCGLSEALSAFNMSSEGFALGQFVFGYCGQIEFIASTLRTKLPLIIVNLLQKLEICLSEYLENFLC